MNPPLLIFAPNRSGRTAQNKHTLENILETFEVVINMVSFDMVEQCSLASVEYEKGVNEFAKAGLTQIPAKRVKPPRVLEAPAQIECIVKQVISLGSGASSGQLVLGEPVMVHIAEESFKENSLDPNLLDLVARMGGNYYCRASGESIFEIAKPSGNPGIGFDALPEFIKTSNLLTGNELAKLASLPELPSPETCDPYVVQQAQSLPENLDKISLFMRAKQLLQENQPLPAMQLLLSLNE